MALRPAWSFTPFLENSFIRQRIKEILGSSPDAGDNEAAPQSVEEIALRNDETQILRRHEFLRDIITFVCAQNHKLDQLIRDKLKYVWSSSSRSGDFTEDIGNCVMTLHRRREMVFGSEVEYVPLSVKQYREYLASGSPKDFCIFLAGICKIFSSVVFSDSVTYQLRLVIKEAEALMSSYSYKFQGYGEIQRFAKMGLWDEITKFSDLRRDIFQIVSEDDRPDDTESTQMEDVVARKAVNEANSTSSKDEISSASYVLTERPTARNCSIAREITKFSDLRRDIFQLVPENNRSDNKLFHDIESPQIEDAAARNVQANNEENSTSSNNEINLASFPLTEKPAAENCSIVMKTDSLSPRLRYRLFLKSVILYVCSLDRKLVGNSKEKMKNLKQSSARSGDFTINIGDYVLSLVYFFRQLEELKGSKLFSLKIEGPMYQRINCRLCLDMDFISSGDPEDFCTFLACVCKFCSSLAAEGQLENHLTSVTVIAASLMHSYLEQFVGYEELDRYACQRL